MEPDPYVTGGLGAALGAAALYVARALYELAKNAGGGSPRSSTPKPGTMTVQQHEELLRIYREIEHSKEDREAMLKLLRQLQVLIKELHEWHDARDEDGVLRWWNKASIERSIKRVEVKVDRVEAALHALTKKTSRSGQYSFVKEDGDSR